MVMERTRIMRLARLLAFVLVACSVFFFSGAEAARPGNRHSRGRVYHVGDKLGWTDGRVDYAGWSWAKEFHVGDKIVFEYEKARYRVMEVSLEDFRRCSPHSPIKIYDSGHDSFVMTQRSHRFFIGDRRSCLAGQKVDIRVLDQKHDDTRHSSSSKSHLSSNPNSSPSPSPNPSSSPPAGSTVIPPKAAPSPCPRMDGKTFNSRRL